MKINLTEATIPATDVARCLEQIFTKFCPVGYSVDKLKLIPDIEIRENSTSIVWFFLVLYKNADKNMTAKVISTDATWTRTFKDWEGFFDSIKVVSDVLSAMV
ncbi:hypothetical protein KAZ57_01570 [Patescibacteria group bacterium]|nr:hypothetical protein [Patescibacteria group bacterium]